MADEGLTVKAQITKGFESLGRHWKPGDEYEDDPGVIEALVRQGYAQSDEVGEGGTMSPQSQQQQPQQQYQQGSQQGGSQQSPYGSQQGQQGGGSHQQGGGTRGSQGQYGSGQGQQGQGGQQGGHQGHQSQEGQDGGQGSGQGIQILEQVLQWQQQLITQLIDKITGAQGGPQQHGGQLGR